MSNDDDRSNSSNNGSSNSNGNGNNQMAIFGEENQFEPCKVCGEQSSGWHCGAVTCEACKVMLDTLFLVLSILFLILFV